MSISSIQKSVALLEKCAVVIQNFYNGNISNEDTENINSGIYNDSIMKKNPFLKTLVDCFYVEKFSIDMAPKTANEQAIVTLYKTGIDTMELLSDLGIDMINAKMIDGYDKTIGDYFNLAINKEESKVVQQIYKWYTEEGYGAAKIANMLNEKGYKTKRNCKWSQNATCRILTNEIYTGKIINGKQEVSDFLTGQRRDKDETEWMVVERPELRIIEDETFEKAQEILRGRHDAFNLSHERQSNKHLFSTLIKCKECGWSFRRTVRTYKNTYVRWVCSGRNGRGVDSCPNKTVVDEEELIEVLQEYFTNVLKQKKKVIAHVVNEFQRVYKAKDENVEYEKELNAELAKLQKTRQKYMDMYTDDLISREELNEKIGGSRQEMERIENELKMVSYHLTKGEQLENILNNTFKEIEDITDVHQMTNQQLKRLIQKIEVDKEGNVDIYLRLLGDLGLDESVLIEENETVLNCDDQT